MMMNSIWANTVELPKFPRLEHDLKTDVLIVGGGIVGILCAYELAQTNIDYTLIEADTICHGVSRNTTAKLTSQHSLIYDKLIRQFGTDAAGLYWHANEAALKRFQQLSEIIPCDFEQESAYVYTLDHSNKLENELRALEKIGVCAEYVKQLPLPFPVFGAIRFDRQAQFHPLKFIAGEQSPQ